MKNKPRKFVERDEILTSATEKMLTDGYSPEHIGSILVDLHAVIEKAADRQDMDV